MEGTAADATSRGPHLPGKPHVRQLQRCCFFLPANPLPMPGRALPALPPELEPAVLRRGGSPCPCRQPSSFGWRLNPPQRGGRAAGHLSNLAAAPGKDTEIRKCRLLLQAGPRPCPFLSFPNENPAGPGRTEGPTSFCEVTVLVGAHLRGAGVSVAGPHTCSLAKTPVPKRKAQQSLQERATS